MPVGYNTFVWDTREFVTDGSENVCFACGAGYACITDSRRRLLSKQYQNYEQSKRDR